MKRLDHYYAVIMAGGGGTRLWPLSRKKTPKQLVKLFGNETLFQISVNRLGGLFSPEKIFVVTGPAHAEHLAAQAPMIPGRNFIIEPSPKGTAAAIGYAAAHIRNLDPQAVIAVLTADHIIKNLSVFQTLLIAAYDAALSRALVTLGIAPTFPATGFGYIHRGEVSGSYAGVEGYQVREFVEKPDEETAKNMISSGNYYWNSGMFIWQVDDIFNEIEIQMPELSRVLKLLEEELHENATGGNYEEQWNEITPQSIDYGVMEKAENVVVLPAYDFGWFDVGSWGAMFDVMQPDSDGNIILANKNILVDTNDSLIYSDSRDRMIVTMGVENLIIVDTGNAMLVINREKSQEIKNVVQYLTDHELNEYL